MDRKAYREAIHDALGIQVLLGVLTSLMFDCGMTFQMWYISMAAYWPMAIMLLIRGIKKPNRIDPYVIRWAFLLLIIVVTPVTTGIIWRWRGVLL